MNGILGNGQRGSFLDNVNYICWVLRLEGRLVYSEMVIHSVCWNIGPLGKNEEG